MIRGKSSISAMFGIALVLASVATLVAVSPHRTVLQIEPKTTPNVIGMTQTLLRALYPEVANKDYILTVETYGTIDRNWTYLPPLEFTVGRGEKGHKDLVGGIPGGKPGGWVEMKPVLGGDTNFDADGIMTNFHAQSDTILFDSVNARFRAKVDSNWRWTDEQISHAMVEAGAKYGPDECDAVLKALPVTVLEPYTGTLHIDSAKFWFRHIQEPHPIPILYWRVEAHGQIGGKDFGWDFVIEPFDGRILSIYRYRWPLE